MNQEPVTLELFIKIKKALNEVESLDIHYEGLSMAPILKSGDLLKIQNEKITNLQKYDIIVFWSQGIIISHVFWRTIENKDGYFIKTKRINPLMSDFDPIFKSEYFLGKVNNYKISNFLKFKLQFFTFLSFLNLISGKKMKIFIKAPYITTISTLKKVTFFYKHNSQKEFSYSTKEISPALLLAINSPNCLTKLLADFDKETILSLVENKILITLPEEDPSPDELANIKHCLIVITGSIYSAQVISMVLELNLKFKFQTEIIVSQNAKKFININLFRSLNIRVWDNEVNFQHGVVAHQYLSENVEFILILPATANTISLLAHAKTSDLITLVTLSSKSPKIIAPSVNQSLWENPIFQRNIDLLRAAHFYVIEPKVGYGIGKKANYGTSGMRPYNFIGLISKILIHHKKSKN